MKIPRKKWFLKCKYILAANEDREDMIELEFST